MAAMRKSILDQLPSPTGVALEVIDLADKEATSAEEIERVLQADPTMAAKIIKLANAPANGVARNIARVSQAVQLLGMQTVKRIALSFSLISNNREGWCRGFDYSTFWSDSLACGVAARHVAQGARVVHAEEAFIVGLLSQLGRLAFATVFRDQYCDICRERGTELIEKERSLFGRDHAAMAAEMMESWRFPASHCLAVRHQYEMGEISLENDSAAYGLASVLRFARLMAQVLMDDAVESGTLSDLHEAAADFDITPVNIELHTKSIAEEWEQNGKVLSIKTRTVAPLSEIYEQAKRHEERLAAGAS
jgi:HD-like signal output (HDOD) protein